MKLEKNKLSILITALLGLHVLILMASALLTNPSLPTYFKLTAAAPLCAEPETGASTGLTNFPPHNHLVNTPSYCSELTNQYKAEFFDNNYLASEDHDQPREETISAYNEWWNTGLAASRFNQDQVSNCYHYFISNDLTHMTSFEGQPE